jgi:hypothetical protein
MFENQFQFHLVLPQGAAFTFFTETEVKFSSGFFHFQSGSTASIGLSWHERLHEQQCWITNIVEAECRSKTKIYSTK